MCLFNPITLSKTPNFSNTLLTWNLNENTRKMPWKGEKDPYKIWISEIILQQTRVAQGISYYERFIKAFPNVKSLAKAPEKKIFKLWEGLGYYSRCKNLIASSKIILTNYNGKFPDNYNDILALKGVGPYTAAAIGSFAFNLPQAVLDGNVFRVLARYFGNSTPINTTEGKKIYSHLSQRLLDKSNAGKYNQAIMDFGAVVCKPLLPLCSTCPFQKKCRAYITNTVHQLPVNKKTVKQRKRYLNYFIIEFNNEYYVRKRTGKDIWENLFEFILVETTQDTGVENIQNNKWISEILKQHKIKLEWASKKYSQKLTHQQLTGQFFHLKIHQPLADNGDYYLVSSRQLKRLPFPNIITRYLKDNQVSLNLL